MRGAVTDLPLGGADRTEAQPNLVLLAFANKAYKRSEARSNPCPPPPEPAVFKLCRPEYSLGPAFSLVIASPFLSWFWR